MESHYVSPENDPTGGAVLQICEIEIFGRYTRTQIIKKIAYVSFFKLKGISNFVMIISICLDTFKSFAFFFTC